eukprot:9315860-Pyramimonas_sp.AAC.1
MGMLAWVTEQQSVASAAAAVPRPRHTSSTARRRQPGPWSTNALRPVQLVEGGFGGQATCAPWNADYKATQQQLEA